MKSTGTRELHAAFEAHTSSLHGSSPPAVASEDMLTLCAPAEKAGLEALLLQWPKRLPTGSMVSGREHSQQLQGTNTIGCSVGANVISYQLS